MPASGTSTLQSDLILASEKFQPEASSTQTQALITQLEEKGRQGGVKWWDVGAPRFREMRRAGETGLPAIRFSATARTIPIPSRQSNRTVPCRILTPPTPPRAITYHIHGGGWVLGGHDEEDQQLQTLADRTQTVVVSVGYRLAPETPHPGGAEDCYDVAAWLVDHGEAEFGARLEYLTGDSAGGHLGALTCFWVMEEKPGFVWKGVVWNYGLFDASGGMPSVGLFDRTVVLDQEMIRKYIEAYLPNTTEIQRRDPSISPFYADLKQKKLPPALFTCGTEDPLLDDTMFMATRWAMSGAESILRIKPGAPHAFLYMPPAVTEMVESGWNDIVTFINEK